MRNAFMAVTILNAIMASTLIEEHLGFGLALAWLMIPFVLAAARTARPGR
jgi:hypothetical protein